MNMKEESVISERGQVTLPKKLRSRLGLKPGTRVKFMASTQGLLIHKADQGASSIRKVYGVIKDHISTDDYLRQIRGKVE